MGSPILDFIKIILVTKYVIKSIKATDPVTTFFFFRKSNIGDPNYLVTGSVALMDFITYFVTKIIL